MKLTASKCAVELIKATNPEAEKFFAEHYAVVGRHPSTDEAIVWWYPNGYVFECDMGYTRRAYNAACIVGVDYRGDDRVVRFLKVRWYSHANTRFSIREVTSIEIKAL